MTLLSGYFSHVSVLTRLFIINQSITVLLGGNVISPLRHLVNHQLLEIVQLVVPFVQRLVSRTSLAPSVKLQYTSHLKSKNSYRVIHLDFFGYPKSVPVIL